MSVVFAARNAEIDEISFDYARDSIYSAFAEF